MFLTKELELATCGVFPAGSDEARSFFTALAKGPTVETLDLSSPHFMPLISLTPVKKYSATDLETLASSEDKRARFVEVHTGSIVPSQRAGGDLFRRFRHYLELPSPTALDPFFAASGIDFTKVCGPNELNAVFFQHCAFVDGWTPIVQRWRDENFSIMQPTEPDITHSVLMMVTVMMAAAGQKEEKLQVSANFKCANWLHDDEFRPIGTKVRVRRVPAALPTTRAC
jgi:hypothetical protein